MQKREFSITINASRQKVRDVLWGEQTLRVWAGIIDEGMYMIGKMEEGAKVQFVSGVPGYGVTSMIEKLTPNEFVLFRHIADTIDGGNQEREKEWTGGAENYALSERDGVTTLTLTADVPPTQEETMSTRLPQALERIKMLVEAAK